MAFVMGFLVPIEPGGGVPTPPIYYPPGIWPSPGHPAHPIAPGGPPGFPAHPIPPGIWPSPPAPGQPPVGIWPSPGYPAHPIAPGGPPPGIWPSPGYPAHPIVLPPPPGPGGVPTHPIYIPPEVWPKPPEDPTLPPGFVWPPLGVVVWVPGYGAALLPTTGTKPEVTPH